MFTGEESMEEGLPPDLQTLFLNNLTVKPVRNSKLVTVSYDSPNKELTARIVNVLAKSYIKSSRNVFLCRWIYY